MGSSDVQEIEGDEPPIFADAQALIEVLQKNSDSMPEGPAKNAALDLKQKLTEACDTWETTNQTRISMGVSSGPDLQVGRNLTTACQKAIRAYGPAIMQYKGLDKLRSMVNSFTEKYCNMKLFTIKATHSTKESSAEKEVKDQVESFTHSMKR
ncbi:MAG: hypothetical protein CK424_05645 [Legionella sp.]|nr:MAG: hypothetical protein CK424_05645 [Legionella sp.]